MEEQPDAMGNSNSSTNKSSMNLTNVKANTKQIKSIPQGDIVQKMSSNIINQLKKTTTLKIWQNDIKGEQELIENWL